MDRNKVIALLEQIRLETEDAQLLVVRSMELATESCAKMHDIAIRTQSLVELLAAENFGGDSTAAIASGENPVETEMPSECHRQAHGGRDTVTSHSVRADGGGVGNGSDEEATEGDSGSRCAESGQAAAAAPGKPGAARTGRPISIH